MQKGKKRYEKTKNFTGLFTNFREKKPTKNRGAIEQMCFKTQLKMSWDTWLAGYECSAELHFGIENIIFVSLKVYSWFYLDLDSNLCDLDLTWTLTSVTRTRLELDKSGLHQCCFRTAEHDEHQAVTLLTLQIQQGKHGSDQLGELHICTTMADNAVMP